MGIKSIFLFSLHNGKSAKTEPKLRRGVSTKVADWKSEQCPRDMSKWKQRIRTNYFSRHGAKRTVVPSKMLYRCENVGIWKFDSQDSEIFGQMENSWPNHKINGYSGSPKSLIQANNGQNSEVVKCWFAPFGAVLTRRKVYGDKTQIVSLSTGVSMYIKWKFIHSSGIISIWVTLFHLL